jgi:hypothetical protein
LAEASLAKASLAKASLAKASLAKAWGVDKARAAGMPKPAHKP